MVNLDRDQRDLAIALMALVHAPSQCAVGRIQAFETDKTIRPAHREQGITAMSFSAIAIKELV